MEKKALEYIEKIDRMGGSVRAIEKGYIQKEIQNSAYDYQRNIEEKELAIVGVNEFQIQEPPVADILKVDESLEKKQTTRLKKLKESRDNQAVRSTLKKIQQAAKGRDNLMPAILAAVKCDTTLGEISNALREVFGVYRENVVI